MNSIKVNAFQQADLIQRNWYIEAGALITEFHVANNARQAASAKLQSDCPLDPNTFKVVRPRDLAGDERIDGHICFQYTNPQGNITFVYVNEVNVKMRPSTWVDANRQTHI